MKKILKAALALLLFIGISSTVALAAISIVPNGGTGVGTITGIIQGNGQSPFTVVTIGSGLSLTAGTLSATGGGVSSFNSRTGAVVPVAGDYSSITETLSNKTIDNSNTAAFKDTLFQLQDDVDTTKHVMFQASSVGTGSTITLTVPNFSSQIAVVGNTPQSFTGITTFTNTFTASAASITLGNSTATTNIGIGNGANASGITKTVNIGSNGVSGSITNIALGSTVSGALGTLTINSPTLNATNTAATFSTVNGIALTAGGSASLFLNQAGSYAAVPAGTVTSVGSGAGLTGGPITSSGSLAIDYTAAGTWTGVQTFNATALFVQDPTDNTKQARFAVANNTSGTTTAYNLPLSIATGTMTLATTNSLTQTFTGQTTFSANFTVSTTSAAFGSSVGTATYGLGSGATTSGLTKTLNIGTGGLSGSTTNINIGSANGTSITLNSLGSGLIKATSGLLSIATAGTDYQSPIALTTTGTSGAATLVGSTLNIPNYATGGSGLTVGTTTISGGSSGNVEYDNAGVLGEMTTSGTGTQLALTAAPTFTGNVSGSVFLASSGFAGSGARFAAGISGVSSAQFAASGTLSSSAAFGTSNAVSNVNISSGTVTSTATAGSPSAVGLDYFGIPTLVATNAQAITNAGTVYIAGSPVASTNVTIASPWSIYVAAGNAFFGGHLSLEGVTSTGATGTGKLVFDTSPTLTTPALGTPSALVGTNITGTGTSFTSGITNALASATTTVNVSSATAPTSGQVLTATSGTAATWQAPGTKIIGSDFTAHTVSTAGWTYTVAIPANTLGTAGGIHFQVIFSNVNVDSTDFCNVAWAYGGTSLGTTNIGGQTSPYNGNNAIIDGYIYANASASAQKTSIQSEWGSVTSTGMGQVASYTATAVTSSSSQNLTAVFTRGTNGDCTAQGITVTAL